MRKLDLLFQIVIIFILITSCSSVQNVVVRTGFPDAEVYVNYDLAGKGDSVIVHLNRDSKIKQIRVEKEGFKPEYRINSQYKGSKYLNLMTITPKIKDIKKLDKEKYVYLNKVAFDIPKDKKNLHIYSSQDYFGSKVFTLARAGDYLDIKIDNTIFTESLNNMLAQKKYTDTSGHVLRNEMNTLYVSATVQSFVLNIIAPKYLGLNTYFGYKCELKIQWEFFDIYKQTLLKETLDAESGEFYLDWEKTPNEMLKYCIEDGLKTSFTGLLSNPKVIPLLQIESPSKIKFDNLFIKKNINCKTDLQEAKNSTVTIKTSNGHGSGFVISKDGYLVTNYHVIAGDSVVSVILFNGQNLKAKVIRFNKFEDLALIKIEKEFDNYVNLIQINNYHIGDDVFAIGTPKSIELGQTLSKGIISSVRQVEERSLIQTNISVNAGNSGGPLISKTGELIGVVNSKLMGFGIEGIAFCIPANEIMKKLFLVYE